MRRLLKYLGIPIMLVGVAILAVPFFMNVQSNATLTAGLVLVVAGFVYYLLAGKYL